MGRSQCFFRGRHDLRSLVLCWLYFYLSFFGTIYLYFHLCSLVPTSVVRTNAMSSPMPSVRRLSSSSRRRSRRRRTPSKTKHNKTHKHNKNCKDYHRCVAPRVVLSGTVAVTVTAVLVEANPIFLNVEDMIQALHDDLTPSCP